MIRMSRLASILATALVAALVASCSAAPAGTARTPASGVAAAPSGEPRTLVENLAVPWGIAFLPGGDALVTERDTARLLRVTPAGKVTEVGEIDGVRPDGEGGLMGVAVSPVFTEDHYVFLYFTSAQDNRIVRYRYDRSLTDATVLLDGIPKGPIHNGGRLAFGPDGYLYASTGETGDRALAQDLGSMAGKILRMTADGKPAPGNPFANVLWSYGHRNVQGMAWDPSGRMYASEFGSSSFDEINLIRKGGNYGWPEVEGVGGAPRFIDPIVTWSTDEASPSGMAYADGSLWVGALRGRRLWQVPLAADGTAGVPAARFEGRYGRLRAVTAAPGGSLWIGTSNKDGRGSPVPGDDRILVLTP
ncbi:Glucose/arabinose dehydrogenase, beta-propeller fold [Streptosporangium canum]|uniref:Glucose/arabinose dehydrogenase, beta-propeller fold n=1 Tax=Streptosporangium canum TaxID=324952 RepID=A0A1I3ZSR2_9ACTN|nr:PQQ-dependent sugar dehydrogenase [Streptosporangium canum]SFK47043.1 Glucose/arabinose dehydrogenase, beta-propeller fold [Streptosporangium canum]